jgi:hypothetical protein
MPIPPVDAVPWSGAGINFFVNGEQARRARTVKRLRAA